MAAGLGAGPDPRSPTWLVRVVLIAVLTAGILAMHALAGGSLATATATHAGHAEMSQGEVSAADGLAAAAVTVNSSGDTGHASMGGHCGVGGICVALVAAGLVLLLAARDRRPLLARRRVAGTLTVRRLLALARLPEPPDLHTLSILRC